VILSDLDRKISRDGASRARVLSATAEFLV